jgi:hypothetical protein
MELTQPFLEQLQNRLKIGNRRGVHLMVLEKMGNLLNVSDHLITKKDIDY